jgi:hypothetical protein
MDIRFGTWKVRSLYRSGSLKTVSRELSKRKLDLVGVQGVRCDKDGTEPADDKTLPCLHLYKPHFFDKNLPSKIRVRLMHGIVWPFDD